MLFRDLKKNEIECRVGIKKQTGFSVLLYKNARVDMDILDETFGEMNWTREQKGEVCRVSIFDEKKNQWIFKEDVGTPSDYEEKKGLSSDSFKRACVNWGIGRELYTTPFIFIKDLSLLKEKIKVSDIEIEDKKIISLTLECNKVIIFSWTCEEYRKIKGISEIKRKCKDLEKITDELKKLNLKTLEDADINQIKTIYKNIA